MLFRSFLRAAPGLFAEEGRKMSEAQADVFDRLAVEIDRLADRACGGERQR